MSTLFAFKFDGAVEREKRCAVRMRGVDSAARATRTGDAMPAIDRGGHRAATVHSRSDVLEKATRKGEKVKRKKGKRKKRESRADDNNETSDPVELVERVAGPVFRVECAAGLRSTNTGTRATF